MSHQVIYLQFGDRETLFDAAAMDLLERELGAELARSDAEPRDGMLYAARHLARNRAYYRALADRAVCLRNAPSADSRFRPRVGQSPRASANRTSGPPRRPPSFSSPG